VDDEVRAFGSPTEAAVAEAEGRQEGVGGLLILNADTAWSHPQLEFLVAYKPREPKYQSTEGNKIQTVPRNIS
jgi:hypothetical protein